MKKLLNTLYVVQEKSYLSLEGETIVVRSDKRDNQVPLCNLEGIVCFNYLGASPALMGKCAEKNISLCFLRPDGKFLARVTGETRGNVHLRRTQYRLFDDEAYKLELAKSIIAAKIHNQRMVLQRGLRDHRERVDAARIEAVVDTLSESIRAIKTCGDADSLRGIEGESARMYYMVFGDLVLNDEFAFHGRFKRPPLDEINAMLSYLYTLAGLEVQSALETVGLDPYIGCFHTDRSGRASLALDLLEEFRAPLVDKTVLSLVNLGQIKTSDFERKEGGAVLFSEEGRKKILTAWHDKKIETMTHPVIREKHETGLLPYVQAQLLAKVLRGDADCYTPFVWG